MLKNQFVSIGIAALLGLALTGCEGPQHKMVEPTAGTKIACRLCYDEMKKVSPSRWAPKGVIKRHKCEECRTEMTVYKEGEVLKMRCDKCAPEGVDCDKCLPPDGAK